MLEKKEAVYVKTLSAIAIHSKETLSPYTVFYISILV